MLSSLRVRVSLPILVLIAVASAVSPISTAHAVTITWSTTGSDSTNPGGGTLAADVGNIKTFTSGAYTLKAAAFSYSPSFNGGQLQKSYLAAYSGGLGVGNTIQSTSSETTSPGHAVDNVGAYDMVIFAFNSDTYDPISTHLNAYGDTDLTFLVGGKLSQFGTVADPFSGFANQTLAQIQANGTWFQHDVTGNGSSVTDLLSPDNGTEVGRYLIIAARITDYSDLDDYFKIDSVAGSPVATPEPSTFLLLGSGLAGLAVRRWRTRAKRAEVAG